MPSSSFVENKRSYEISKLKQIHHEILNLALLGYQNVEIAEKLDVTPQMISYTLNSQVAQEKLKIMRQQRDVRILDVSDRVKEVAPVALQELERMLVDPNTGENNKRKIAEDIIEWSGEVQKNQKHEGLTTEEISKIKKLARKRGYIADVEEAEVVKEEEGEHGSPSESYDADSEDINNPLGD